MSILRDMAKARQRARIRDEFPRWVLCGWCFKETHVDDSFPRDGGGYLCASCAQKAGVFRCDGCGLYFNLDIARKTDGDETSLYCPECLEWANQTKGD